MKKLIAMLIAVALVTPFSVGCGDTKKKSETKKVETKTDTNGSTEKTETTEKTEKTTDEK
jgi:hypothetical protein